MRALVYDGVLSFRDDYPPPRRAPGESLVRVMLAGICATDCEIVKGYMGYRGIPGHEFVGVVEESDTRELLGRRVVGEINCPCGKCTLCAAGLGNHCAERSVLGILHRDGAFAEHLTLPDSNLHPVPDGVSDREAVFTEPLAAACRALEQAELSEKENVTILGDGRLGILAAMVFSSAGVPVKLVGKDRRKLALAAGDRVAVEVLGERGARRDADVVVDATGSPSGLECALKIVRPTGKIILKTTIAEPYRLDLAPLVVDEVTLIGSRCGPFKKAIELLDSRRLDILPLVSAEYPLDRGPEAFEKAGGEGVVKVLLKTAGSAGIRRNTPRG